MPIIEFMDGGELGGAAGLWGTTQNVTATTPPAGQGWSGNYYYQRQGGMAFTMVTARDSYYMGIRCRNEGYIFTLWGNGGIHFQGRLQNESGRIRYYGNNVGLSKYSDFMTTGEVMRVEMYIQRQTYTPPTPLGAGTSNNDGRVIVKVNNVIIIDETGKTVGYNYPIDIFGVSGEWNQWDDAILTVDDWPGNVRIQGGVPNEAGSSTEWDPSTGNNFECVNEVPPSDTDFNSTNVSDELDMYGMTPLVETYPIESILGIQLSARAKLEGTATPKDLQLAILSGATYDYSSNKQVEDDTYKWPSQVWSLNPATGKPFTPAEINSLQIGIKSKTR